MSATSESVIKTDPSKFLSNIIGSTVSVKLHNGVEYLGNLQSIDGYMNIVLDETKEFVGGKPSNKNYGDFFIRGNNVLYISEE
ncbi:U6 snRNA-associated Sm-like protein LSm6 [[Candida] anglica]